jgi:hypothetical protein
MSEFVVAMWGFVICVLVMMIDGRGQLMVSTLGAALAVAPALMFALGADAGSIILVGAALIWICATLAKMTARRSQRSGGLSIKTPITAKAQLMFGPRSVRAMATMVALAGASWVSLNVRVAGQGVAVGAVFAVSFLLLIALMRCLVADSIEDLGGGMVAGAFAASAALMLESGTYHLPETVIPLLPALLITTVLVAYQVRQVSKATT